MKTGVFMESLSKCQGPHCTVKRGKMDNNSTIREKTEFGNEIGVETLTELWEVAKKEKKLNL